MSSQAYDTDLLRWIEEQTALLRFEKAWQQARRGAVKSFHAYGEAVEVPELCPYSLEPSMDQDFIPPGAVDAPAQ